MKPRVRLIVHLKDGPERTVEIDFSDYDRFRRQLAAFESQRTRRASRPYGKLYEFTNAEGDTLAFAEQYYVRHEVVDLDDAWRVSVSR